MLDPLIWNKIGTNFGGKEQIFWKNGKNVPFLRTILQFGGPLRRKDVKTEYYKHKEDRKEEQKAKYVEYQSDLKTSIEEFSFMNINATMISDSAIQDEVFAQAEKDTMWAIGSVCAVLLYFIFHL